MRRFTISSIFVSLMAAGVQAQPMGGDSLVIKSATLPHPIHSMVCAADPVSGKIYGFGGTTSNRIVEYDPQTGLFAFRRYWSSMLVRLDDLAALVVIVPIILSP